jgi:hypothetical protein
MAGRRPFGVLVLCSGRIVRLQLVVRVRLSYPEDGFSRELAGGRGVAFADLVSGSGWWGAGQILAGGRGISQEIAG